MRPTRMIPYLLIAQLGWALCATSQASPVPVDRPLTIIPTAVEELSVLRMDTNKKAVLNDGTLSTVYVSHFPAKGNIYLNFHVDVASETGTVMMHRKDLRLDSTPGTPATTSYIPMDWFVDTGSDEVRGEALKVEKAIVQFTIEVPKAGLENLTLFVHSQRIGTVREIRERITKDVATQ